MFWFLREKHEKPCFLAPRTFVDQRPFALRIYSGMAVALRFALSITFVGGPPNNKTSNGNLVQMFWFLREKLKKIECSLNVRWTNVRLVWRTSVFVCHTSKPSNSGPWLAGCLLVCLQSVYDTVQLTRGHSCYLGLHGDPYKNSRKRLKIFLRNF